MNLRGEIEKAFLAHRSDIMEPAILPIIFSYSTLVDVSMFDCKDECQFEFERFVRNFQRKNMKILGSKKYMTEKQKHRREMVECIYDEIITQEYSISQFNNTVLWYNPAKYRLKHKIDRLIRDLKKIFPVSMHTIIQKMTINAPEIKEIIERECRRLFDQIGGLLVKRVSFTVDHLWYRRTLNSGFLEIEVEFPFEIINNSPTNGILKILNIVLFDDNLFFYDHIHKNNCAKFKLTY